MANGTLKVSNIQTSSGSGTITLGQSGETIALGSGVVNKVGISEMDMWYLTSNFTISTADTDTQINSNWARWSQGNFTKKGTGMTESSGTFSFPSTGYWNVYFQGYINATSASPYTFIYIAETNDDSTYTRRATHVGSVSAANYYTPLAFNTIIRCTDTSNDKIRIFGHTDVASMKLDGNSTTDFRTGLIFTKIGDL